MGSIGADEIAAAWRRELPGVPTSSIGVITPLWRAAKLLADDRRRTLARLGIEDSTLDLLSAVLTTTALAPLLRQGGSVVTVGSIGAEYAGSSYGAAKAALAAWTAGVSAELGPAGVSANTVSPGYIAGTDFFHGRLSDERRERLIAATHDGRPGTVEDIAETVLFLASEGARHLTGQVLHVNGGAFTTR